LDERHYNRQEPRIFYSNVCDFRADLFRSKRLFTSAAEQVELSTIAEVGEFTDETDKDKLCRESSRANERLSGTI